MRLLARFSLALALLLVGSPAWADTEYYPLKMGHEWEYKLGDDTIVIRVTKMDDQGATLAVFIGGTEQASETMVVKDDGVYRTRSGTNEVKPPVKILEMKDGKPAAKGTSWKVDSKFGSKHITGSFEVASDKETVKLPAGEFDTVVVKGDLESSGVKFGAKYWFAPKKGVVKLGMTEPGRELVFDLKEFREGKDAPQEEKKDEKKDDAK